MCGSAAMLAERGLRSMAAAKMKLGVLFVLAASLLAGGAGVIARQAFVTESPQAAQRSAQPPATRADRKSKEEPQARVDRYGDPLPPGAIARLGTLRFRHEDTAEGLVFSPDGKILAGVGWRGIYLWDAASGRPLHRLTVSTSTLWSRPFDFSPDGKRLACLDRSGVIRFWDVVAGRQIRTMPAPKSPHYQGDDLRFTPDGKRLVLGCREAEVHIVDAETGAVGRQIRVDRTSVYSFAPSPDGKTLALATNNAGVQLYDMETGKRKSRIALETKNKNVFCLALSTDGKHLAVGGWDQILVVETATGKELARFEAKCESVNGLIFTSDGRTLLSSSQDGKLRMWDVAARKLHRTLDSRARLGRCLALSPDGKTVAMGTASNAIRLWNVADGAERFREFVGPDSEVNSAAFSADGRTLFTSEDNRQVHAWSTTRWREEQAFAGGRSLSLTPDGRRMAWMDGKRIIHVRDVAGEEPRRWELSGGDRTMGPTFADGDTLLTTDYK